MEATKTYQLLPFANEELSDSSSGCVTARLPPCTEEQQWAAEPDLYLVQIYNSNW